MTYQHFFPALKLSVQPSATATGTVEAHLIPSINFGVSAFGGTTEAEIFVNIDGSSSVTLSASAQENLGRRSATGQKHGGEIRGRGLIGEAFFAKRSPGIFGDIADDIKGAASSAGNAISSAAGAVKDAVTGKEGSDGASDASSTAAPAADTAAPSTDNSSNSNGDGTAFGGCADVNAGLSVDVGANAAFFNIFNPSTQLSLFSKTFPLFKVRCIS